MQSPVNKVREHATKRSLMERSAKDSTTFWSVGSMFDKCMVRTHLVCQAKPRKPNVVDSNLSRDLDPLVLGICASHSYTTFFGIRHAV